MTKAFLSVLNLSLTASYVIVFIMLVRLPLKKAPSVISYALWSIALFRLVCPLSLSCPVSAIPSGLQNGSIVSSWTDDYIGETWYFHDHTKEYEAAVASGRTPVSADEGGSYVVTAGDGISEPKTVANSVIPLLSVVWFAGIAVMLIYSVLSIFILKSRLKSARNTGQNLYEADNLKTPFVLGILRPRIYIPAGLAEEEKGYIVRHELTHIRRYDHVVKPLAFLVLSIHWFNPLVWAAYVLMGTDMERCCDERVIREMGGGIRKAYSASLLSLAAEKRMINGSPLAFGEGNVEGRIKNVLNFRKPAAWVIIAAATLAAAAGVGLAVNPADEASPSRWGIYRFPSYEYDRVTFTTDAAAYSPQFGAITATLTNREMESGLMCGEEFVLVKKVGSSWRTVPFTEDTLFYLTATELSVGTGKTYTLTPYMLSYKLETGNYRIVTEVWYANEAAPQTKRTVWADFTVGEEKAETNAEASEISGGPASGHDAADIAYTEDEIQGAMDCVRTYFAETATSRVLNDLWFDEEACEADRVSYMQYGRGSINGVAEENVIVLLCNFTIEDDETFRGYYPNWKMILVRDSADGAWRLDDQGV
ncbi:M56 family metallopeptidase [Papillibacter cinnamivorans]|uniref:Signal transducer regulating beta-lactamase production, contains metallopeptidase domain n=1 Tax=Papillibacter cinnamivorans DSM 12816 TaxID=1122930 RepID=A0A1W1ZEK6_9FIRM|nr:M56 family metallopeptidase [Papillibacter cinnamivorans]SMC46458.1 Signal transducer regulating beta-lactamase production, contains metallopeptidase domain [Papillibacter cinnamivorans DSM 12816]